MINEAAREFQAKERSHKKQLKRCLSSALSADLNRLLQEELEADVSLFSGSGSMRAHRAVLLARAPHILHSAHKDPTTIHLPGYEISTLNDFIRRVYTADQRMHLHGINPDAYSDGITPDTEGSLPASKTSVPEPPDLHTSNNSDAVIEPASGLGADLLDLYRRGEQCDITIQVAEQVFSCHRAILCARSQYFRAMLSGSWMESSRQCITLQGLRPDEMEILLQFMYGAITDLPSRASPSQVILAADMLGLEGLKDVVEFVLTRDYCRFFPKVRLPWRIPHCCSLKVPWAQLFKKFNLDQNDSDLEISCFAIQDQVIHLTVVPVFQSNIGLDNPDLDTNFSRLPNPDYWCSM
ncbi:hypothetical protein LDENG_00160490 [Lucifuga dentata]|nr:hypothetical protein LDENG_00160490 [Lucifuga dentata]